MISRLRRAELRTKSTKALGKTRRESLTRHRVLKSELRVSVRFLDAGGPTYISDGTPCDVTLAFGRLKLLAKDEEFELELIAGCEPKLVSDSGNKLIIEGTLTFAADDADGRRAKVMLSAPDAVQPSSDAAAEQRKPSIFGRLPALTPRGLLTARRRASALSSGPSLPDWHVAIGREIPELELSLEDADKELRQLRLYPILYTYELRTFYWEIVECARKLSVVGLPVFFEPGSSEQLTFGLLICFLSITVFALNRPCRDPKDDILAVICLIEVFIALLAAIVLRYEVDFPEDAVRSLPC